VLPFFWSLKCDRFESEDSLLAEGLLYPFADHSHMRKLAASSILFLILGPLLTPVISAAAPSPLPACCRRGGAHHCSMMAEVLTASGNAFRGSNPCPMRQGPKLATLIAGLPLSSSAQIEIARQLMMGNAVSRRHFTPVDTHHQRGPPALL
jgi:hypothetical protein